MQKLRRVAIGPISDRGLAPGHVRELTEDEVRQVYDAIVELCRKGWRPCDADAGRILCTGNKVGKSGRKIACWRPVGVQLDLFGEAKGS